MTQRVVISLRMSVEQALSEVNRLAEIGLSVSAKPDPDEWGRISISAIAEGGTYRSARLALEESRRQSLYGMAPGAKSEGTS